MRPRVKLCGLTRVEDVRAAVAAGADYVGFVLVPSSRRRVMPAELGELLAAVPAEVATVLVVADEPAATLRRLVAEYRPAVLQLHGRESAEVAREIADCGAEIWKAVVLRDAGDVAAYADFPAARLVVDAAQGGSGRQCDWRLAAALALLRPVLLAGGIGPANAVAAWRATGAWGIDVASGVEDAPGIKSTQKINELMAAVRSLRKEQ